MDDDKDLDLDVKYRRYRELDGVSCSMEGGESDCLSV
jgi:hypothetical protein